MILKKLLNPSSIDIKQELDLKGAVIVKNFLNQDSIKKISYEYEKFLNDHIKFKNRFSNPGTNGLRILDSYKNFQKQSKLFIDLIAKSNTYIKDCTKKGLNENSQHILYLHTDNEKIITNTEWHMDPNDEIKFFVCLEKSTIQNGATQISLGSHIESKYRYFYRNRKYFFNMTNGTIFRKKELIQNAVISEREAGDLLIFRTGTFHKAGDIEKGFTRRCLRWWSHAPTFSYKTSIWIKKLRKISKFSNTKNFQKEIYMQIILWAKK